mmetsp:Transcript_28186/g.59065  ORF Transcript_28186/g.59065 Transcript_28186/m.59065 type:complete len:551 (+) Transcript_28186:115-1767(+)
MDDRGGGRGYYRGGGGRHRHHRGRGRGRGRGSRHQPYNNNRSRHNNYHGGGGGGGRGRGRPGNRFGANSFTQQDPNTAMIRQVFSFVSRVGEFKNIRESEPAAATADGQQGLQLRPVEATSAGNINDLVTALCSEDKLDMLFKCQPASMPVKAEEKVGKLGHLVVSCSASLPLQTPCYAALTLAVNEQIKGSQWEGFASRCVNYATHNFAVDLDTILGTGKNVAQAACRLKLLLRYLAILGRMGIVKGYEEGSDHGSDSNKLTVFGLLSMLVQTAKVSQERNLPATVAHLLSSLVLSTLPYVIEYVPQEVTEESILRPIDALLRTYKSTFTPGTGCTSILLKGEQDDGEEMDDDEEEEDTKAVAASSSESSKKESTGTSTKSSPSSTLPGDEDMKTGEITVPLNDTSEVVTDKVRVALKSSYRPERSESSQDKYCFAYSIRITNESDNPIQLVSRRFEIQSVGLPHKDVVSGPGVTGRQPILKPGESFEYTSTAPLNVKPMLEKTPILARMSGEYNFVILGEDGTTPLSSNPLQAKLGLFHFILPALSAS